MHEKAGRQAHIRMLTFFPSREPFLYPKSSVRLLLANLMMP